MADLFKNFIGGKWLRAKSDATFENRNPANRDDLIGVFPASTAEDVDAAVQAAKSAFATWRLVPAPKRGEILYRVGELLRNHKEEIARGMTREMGKILKETRGDVQEGIDTAFYVAGEGRRLFGETTPAELPDKFAMSVRMPVGVCALITPWNFPVAIPTWKMFPALLCGNAVVLKPAEDTPASAARLVEILAEAGMLVIALTVDRTTGSIVAGPEIASRGFVYMKEADALMEEVKAAVREALAARRAPEVFDRELVGATVRSAVRRFVNQRFQRKPVVLPVILEV
jgi:acyl-CoA reductase-like NAD-dependent aldehyde dehydrogenase